MSTRTMEVHEMADDLTLHVKTQCYYDHGGDDQQVIEITHEGSSVQLWTTDTDVNVDSLIESISSTRVSSTSGGPGRVSMPRFILEYDYRADPQGESREREMGYAMSKLSDRRSVGICEDFIRLFDKNSMNTRDPIDNSFRLNIILTVIHAMRMHEDNPSLTLVFVLDETGRSLTTRVKAELVDAMDVLCHKINGMMIMPTLDPYIISRVHRKNVYVFHEDGIEYDSDGHRIDDGSRHPIVVNRPSIETYHGSIDSICADVLGLETMEHGR